MNTSFSNYKCKFFGNGEQSIPIAKHLYLKDSANEVIECLKSEGVVINDPDSIFKALDIILRAVNIHHEPDDSVAISGINSFIGISKLNGIITDDNIAHQLAILFDEFQSLVKSGWQFPDDDLKVIKDNIEIVIKELTTYYNDIVATMVNEFDPNHCSYILANFTSKDSSSAFFEMVLAYHENMNVFGITISSTMLAPDKNPKLNVIGSTFTDQDVYRITQSLGIDKEGKEDA